MKFLNFVWYETSKFGDMVPVSDEVLTNLPEDIKMVATYVCQGNPFPGIQFSQPTIVAVSVTETDNHESMATLDLQLALAGTNIHRVPLLDYTGMKPSDMVKKLQR